MPIDLERLIHSFKTVIACTVALLFAKLIGLSADQWIVITVIVVMCAQIYVGSVVQKAYLRFLGTLGGCLVASIALLSFGDTYLAILGAIALSSFIFSYFATEQENLSYVGTLGAVTTAIIMLGNHPTILFAIQRFLEISIGILIATLISQYILPIRARTHLRRAQVVTLEQLREFYIAAMVKHTLTTDDLDLDENIIKTLLKQRQLAKESKRESLNKPFDNDYFLKTLYYERAILRAIWSMYDAFTKIDQAEVTLGPLPALIAFNTTTQQTFATMINVITTNGLSKTHIHLLDLTYLRDAVQNRIGTTSPEQVIYANGFLFSAEVLSNALKNLADLYQIS